MRTALRRMGAVVMVAAAWILLTASGASAHADLVASTPVAGEHLDRGPAAVTLRFTEPVTLVPAGVRLLDSSGRAVNRGPASRVADHPEQVTLPLPANLADGNYLVVWRVVSLDSHPIAGSFLFSVGTATGGPAPTAPDTAADAGVTVASW